MITFEIVYISDMQEKNNPSEEAKLAMTLATYVLFPFNSNTVTYRTKKTPCICIIVGVRITNISN